MPCGGLDTRSIPVSDKIRIPKSDALWTESEAGMIRLLSSAAAAALISAAAATLLPGEAAAADLSFEAPPVVAPLPVPHNWTGFYIGLHAGYGWAGAQGDDDDFDGDGDVDLFEDAD